MTTKTARQGGFTLIEIVVALTVMAVLAAGTIPYMRQKLDVARATKAAEEMKGWLEAGIAYYVANSAWPADANALVTAGYMTSNDLNTPFGGTYSLAVTGSSLQVSANITKLPDLVQSKLPLSTLSGSTVSSRVTTPGTESAHARLLNRYGDGGNNKMFATLDMNNNPIEKANYLQLNNAGGVSAKNTGGTAGNLMRRGSDDVTYIGEPAFANETVINPGGAVRINNTGDVTFSNTGKVGIGTTNPLSRLAVAGTQANSGVDNLAQLIVGDGGNARLLLGYDTTNSRGYVQAVHNAWEYKPLTLQPNGGNVGIGTPTPNSAYALDVNGKLYVNNDAAVGGNSTVTGNVSASAVQLNSTVTAGAACSPNGLQAKDSTGKLLSCSSGVWASAGGITTSGGVAQLMKANAGRTITSCTFPVNSLGWTTTAYGTADSAGLPYIRVTLPFGGGCDTGWIQTGYTNADGCAGFNVQLGPSGLTFSGKGYDAVFGYMWMTCGAAWPDT